MNENISITYLLLDLVELAIECSDLDNCEDIEIIFCLLECCESSTILLNKKREWVKPWRVDGVERCPFSLNALFNDSSSFLNQMRMNPSIFNYILSKIEKDIKKRDTIMRKSVAPEEKLAATIRYLATGDSYKNTNYKTRISDSVLCTAIPEVCKTICKHFKDEFLKFPLTKSEWEEIAKDFEAKRQFPHCLGVLDAKHIEFQSLRKDLSLFYNHNGASSILLLALVDANYRITYIHIGHNGSRNPAEVFLRSDLKNVVIDNAEKYLPADQNVGNGRKLPYVIIANDVFPLHKHIMKPYSHSTNKKRRKIFNVRLERTRRVANRAFAILSGRFKILQTRIKLSVEKVELITKTCCILHNLLSAKNANYLNDPLPSAAVQLDSFDTSYNNFEKSAQSVRQEFEEYFTNEGRTTWQEYKL